MAIDGGRGRCELVSEGLAEHDGARPAEAGDALGVLRRHMISKEARSVRGPHAGRRDDVLYSAGYAVERSPPPPRGDLGPRTLRLLQCAVGAYGEERRDARIDLLDPLQEGFHALCGGDLSPADAAGEIVQAEMAKRLGAHRHSFSPERAIPRTKARWNNRKISAAGIIPRTAIAMISW